MSEEASCIYLIDKLSPNVTLMRKVKSVLYSYRTKYQHVELVETYDLGLCLLLDGKLQSSTLDEWIYHECIVHPPMLTHPNPKRVAIVGGGEGATVREVLRHNTVEEVVMVDLDEEVVRLAKERLKMMHQGALESNKLKLLYMDGRKYLEEEKGSFNVIIIDVTDPIKGGPSYLLYTKEFYDLLMKKLDEVGVIVTQATSTHYSFECLASIFKTVSASFPIARLYRAWIPSYGSEWSFILGSKFYDPVELNAETILERLRSRRVENLKFYTPKLHQALFTLPKFLEDSLSTVGRVIRDDSPIYVT